MLEYNNASFASCHSLSERLWLKSIVAEWRKYHRQVKRDKQLFFSVRDFVIRRLTKKAYRAIKINYAWQMLAKHMCQRRDLASKVDCLRAWRSKLLKRISIRMFFVKFLEYRAAQRLGFETWKGAKDMTSKVKQIIKAGNSRL